MKKMTGTKRTIAMLIALLMMFTSGIDNLIPIGNKASADDLIAPDESIIIDKNTNDDIVDSIIIPSLDEEDSTNNQATENNIYVNSLIKGHLEPEEEIIYSIDLENRCYVLSANGSIKVLISLENTDEESFIFGEETNIKWTPSVGGKYTVKIVNTDKEAFSDFELCFYTEEKYQETIESPSNDIPPQVALEKNENVTPDPDLVDNKTTDNENEDQSVTQQNSLIDDIPLGNAESDTATQNDIPQTNTDTEQQDTANADIEQENTTNTNTDQQNASDTDIEQQDIANTNTEQQDTTDTNIDPVIQEKTETPQKPAGESFASDENDNTDQMTTNETDNKDENTEIIDEPKPQLRSALRAVPPTRATTVNPIMASVYVVKTVTGQERPQEKTFTFEIENDINSPAALINTTNITGSGVGMFYINFTNQGDYTYTIKEKNTNNKGYTYDSSSYTVKIHVEENDGSLSATQKIYKNGAQVSSVSFSNNYVPLSTTHTINVIKRIQGVERPDVAVQGETFNFKLTPIDGAPMPSSDTISILDVGTESYAPITYTSAGTYVYTVEELRGNSAPYTYEPDSKIVTIDVDDRNGQLVATMRVDGLITNDVIFTNEYTPVQLNVSFDISKEITNQKPASDSAFRFSITAENTQDPYPQPSQSIATMTGEGTLRDAFSLTFNKRGTYKYTIKELDDGNTGYEYDPRTYELTINVENNNGRLEYEASFYDGTHYTTGIEFKNEYTPNPVSIVIPVKKNMAGGHNRPSNKTFSFLISNETENAPMPEHTTVRITDSGEKEFDSIEFTKAGTYVYTIKELATEQNGYTNDTTVYTVTAVVTDVNGNLSCEWNTTTESGTNTNKLIEYTNKYVPYPVTLTLPVTKKVTGNDRPQEADFTFKIEAISSDGEGSEKEPSIPMPSSDEITINGNGNRSFADITYKYPGTYTYKVTEVNDGLTGYTYDDTEYEFTVNVEDIDGNLVVTNKSSLPELKFENKYKPVFTTITIPINKVVTGSERPESEIINFSFTLEGPEIDPLNPPTQDTPMPMRTVLDIRDEGSATFGPIKYEEVGDFEYTITESPTNNRDYIDDQSNVRTIKVKVTDNAGQLEALAKYYDGTEQKDDVTFTNEYAPYLGQIKITKNGLCFTTVTNEQTAGIDWKDPQFEILPIAGATVEVYANENIYGNDGSIRYAKDELIETLTSTTDEYFLSKELPLGKYYVLESAAPDGYVKSDEKHPVELIYKGENIRLVYDSTTITNTYMNSEINLTKAQKNLSINIIDHDNTQSSLITESGEGYVFGLFAAEDIQGKTDTLSADDIVAVGTTDDKGAIKFEGMFPYGNYYVAEIQTKDGWLLNETHFPVSLIPENGNEDNCIVQNIDGSILNDLNYKLLTITKRDELESHTVPGALMELKKSDGTVVWRGRTDRDGEIKSIPVAPGNYTLTEIEAPEGYILNPEEVEINVSDTEEHTEISAEMTNTPVRGQITIEKKGLQLIDFEETTDPVSGLTYQKPIFEERYLAGVTYEIHAGEVIKDNAGNVQYEKDAIVETVTTTADGQDKSSELFLGKYYLVETSAPDGYLTSDEEVEVNLAYKDQETRLIEVTKKFNNAYLPYEVNLTKSVTDLKITERADNTITSSLYNREGEGFTFGLLNNEAIQGLEGTADANSVIAIGTTDNNGKLKFTGYIPHGSYTVKELKTIDGWNLNTNSWTVNITPENKTTNDIIVQNVPETIQNDLNYQLIHITKIDNKENHNIPDALMELKKEDGTVVWRGKTDMNGEIIDIPVIPGKYTLKELEAPEGYIINTDEITIIVPDDVEHSEIPVEMEDTPVRGQLTIKKTGLQLVKFEEETDPVSGLTYYNPIFEERSLGDAKFNLYAAEEIKDNAGNTIYEKNQLVETITTEAGVIENKSTILPLGRYYLKEVSAPSGYVYDENAYMSVDLLYKDQETPLIEVEKNVENTYMPYELTLTKESIDLTIENGGNNTVISQLEREKGEGFTFGLINVNKITGLEGEIEAGNVIAIGTTDETGNLKLTGYVPHGEYIVKELKTIYGQILHTGEWPVSITPENANIFNVIIQTISETIINDLNYKLIHIIKKDSEDGFEVAGAVMELTKEDGTVVWRGETDLNGEIKDIPAVPGNYVLKEIKAPTGYVLNHNTVDIEVEDSEEHTEIPVEFENTPVRGQITVEKKGLRLVRFEETVDPESGLTYKKPVFEERYLPDVNIEIHAAEDIKDNVGNILYSKDELVETITTTADGMDKSSELYLGKYYLKEVSSPDGYIWSDENYNITLAYKDEETRLIEVTQEIRNEYLPYKVSLHKDAVDVVTETGTENLVMTKLTTINGEGYTFGLLNKAQIDAIEGNAAPETVIAIGTTDREGNLVFSGYIPHGSYTLKELKTKDGWILNETPIDLNITSDNKNENNVIEYNIDDPILNDLNYKLLTIIKKDNIENHNVPGALVELTNEDGTVIWRGRTDRDGEIKNIPVVPGDYTLTEIEAPNGYYLNTQDTPTITVTDEPEHSPISLELENRPVRGVISILKTGLQLVRFEETTDANSGLTYLKPVFEELPLPGAVFEVYAGEDIRDNAGNYKYAKDALVGTITTTDTKHDSLSDLYLGKYYIIETSAPDGYLFQSDPINVELRYKDQDTQIIEVEKEVKNTYLPYEVNLTKTATDIKRTMRADNTITSSLYTKDGEGFTFGLINNETIDGIENSAEAGSVIAIGTTDRTGKLKFEGYIPHGSYTVKELKTIDGWNINTNTWTVNINQENVNSDNVIVQNIDEPILNDLSYQLIHITKIDNKEAHNVAGALMELKNSNGTIVWRGKTDLNGEIKDIPVVPGVYTLKELKAPTGYILNTEEITVNVPDEIEHNEISVEVENIPVRGQITIENTASQVVRFEETTDPESGLQYKKPIFETRYLAGAVFNLYAAENIRDNNGNIVYEKNSLVETITTTADGQDKTSRLYLGKYRLQQVSAPSGYVLFDEPIEVTLRYKDELTELIEDTEYVENEYLPYEFALTKKAVDIKKIERADNTISSELYNKAGAGYTFGLVNNNDITGLDETLPAENIVAIGTTNALGTLALNGYIPHGEYTVKELKVPDGWLITEDTWNILITPENANDLNIIVQEIENSIINDLDYDLINLHKHNNKDDHPVPGAILELAKEDGEVVWRGRTNLNGEFLRIPVIPGKYTLKEMKAPTGYILNTEPIEIIVPSEKEHKEIDVTMEDTPVKGQLTIEKKGLHLIRFEETNDEESGITYYKPVFEDRYLEGATYEIRAAAPIWNLNNEIIYNEDDLVDTVTTTSAGGDKSSELYLGRYYIQETSAPEGYVPDTEKYYINFFYMGDSKPIIEKTHEAYNQYMTYRLSLGKEIIEIDQQSKSVQTNGVAYEQILRKLKSIAGKGYTFGIINKNKLEGLEGSLEAGNVVAIGTTDENGNILFSGYVPHGEYIVKELKTLPGWILNESEHPVELIPANKVDGEAVIEQNIDETIINDLNYKWIKFTKLDQTEDHVVPGALIEVTDKDGNVIVRNMTDASGLLGSIPVRPGVYTIKEVQAPDGYLLNSTPITVEADDSEEHDELSFDLDNIPVRGQVIIHNKGDYLVGFAKYSSEGYEYNSPVYEDRYLDGSVFEVYAAETIKDNAGNVICEKDSLVDTVTTTNEGANASVELYLGKYYIKQVNAPTGYYFSSDPVYFTLAYADQVTPVVKYEHEVRNDYIPYSIYLNKIMQEIVTETLEGGMIHQRVQTVVGEGIVFGLYNKDRIESGETVLEADSLVAVKKTDANGSLVFDGLLPHGDYYVKELKTLNGLHINEEEIPITLVPDEEATEIGIIDINLSDQVLNELIYKDVTISAKNLNDENPIPNVLLELVDKDGTVICREITNAYGRIENIPVVPGRYTYKELLVPEGYSLNTETKSFTVNDDLTITGETTIRNDFSRVIFEKHDSVDGSALEGAEFSLFNADHKAVMTAISGKNGMVVFEKLPFGTFTIEETKQVVGYLPKVGSLCKAFVVDGLFVNDPKPSGDIKNTPNEVKVLKTDNNNNPLHGAKFGLFDKDGKEVQSAVSDANGIVTFKKLPYGTYTIKETEAPEGYLISRTVATVKIDDSFVNSEKALATFVNKLKRIRYIKKDTNGNPLSGAEFELINAANGNVAERVTSNANGEFTFTKFDYGDWIVRETKAPEGFLKMGDISFHVDENWSEPEPYTCVDIPNSYTFKKVNHQHAPLEGVKFTLEDETGKTIQKMVSGSDGLVKVVGLKYGKYVIRETETLPGYAKTDDVITLEIDENYTEPSEIFCLINYPNIQTGIEINNPWIYTGATILAIALLALLTVVIKKKKQTMHK